MIVVQINAVCENGSTGKICFGIKETLDKCGIENYILFTNGESDYGIKYASNEEVKINAVKARLLGNYGLNSKFMTKRLINKLEELQPDVIHLHNIHGHNCNLEMLFKYLKGKKVIWTFHDCWAFTGYCMHFDYIKCERWRNMCMCCPQAKEYSLFRDRSSFLFDKKRELFKDMNLQIVVPSKWMEGLVRESFFNGFPIKVINNGIDLEVFRPRNSSLRENYKLVNKKIVLGVAHDWGIKKGLDVFVELSKELDKDYMVVLVGTTKEIEKRLPPEILPIRRTKNQYELAEIYTCADVFVNPTKEDTFSLVNIEALACGTPVITMNTGGSPECITKECGVVVNNYKELVFWIKEICSINLISRAACCERAKEYDLLNLYRSYLDVYNNE